MFTIPNQSSIPKAYTQFTDEASPSSEDYFSKEGGSRLLPSGNRDRLVDCMEEFVKYTIVMRPHFELFGDRFSERMENEEKFRKVEVAKEAERKAEEELNALTNGFNGVAINPPENPNA
jgi:arsenic resistance protein ArsH